tara:strand:+ start:460 stop:654 length:195 start_codon:yes stop_codon:yes gene_type:complete
LRYFHIGSLSSIASDIIILKDEEGMTYLPEWGFNGIGELSYGEGYQIKLYNQVDGFQFCPQIAN